MWEADVGQGSHQSPAKARQCLRQRARHLHAIAPGAVSPDYRPRIGKRSGRTMAWRIGVDSGGTFTDICLCLPPRQRAEMIAGVTGGKPLPQEIVAQIIDRTDGVPLLWRN
jgi:hypothetical protein